MQRVLNRRNRGFISSSFGNSFNKPVQSCLYTCSCEGSWCTSVTQTEINHLWAASEKDRFQYIFIIDFTNFDAQKAGNCISESSNFKLFWWNMPSDPHGKGGLSATYISWAAYFYTGRHLLQMLLKAVWDCNDFYIGKMKRRRQDWKTEKSAFYKSVLY